MPIYKPRYLPEDDDICTCGHFAGSTTDRHCDECDCKKFDLDEKATLSNWEAEEATWD